jgi:hypothetical protein
MSDKVIFTHVSTKALKGIQRLSEISGSSVYMHPVPYGKHYDRFTVVMVKK